MKVDQSGKRLANEIRQLAEVRDLKRTTLKYFVDLSPEFPHGLWILEKIVGHEGEQARRRFMAGNKESGDLW